MGDRDITVREDKAAPPKAAPERTKTSGGSKAASSSTVPAADGCRVYVGNLAWETTEEELIGACTAAVSAAAAGRRRGSNPTQPAAGFAVFRGGLTRPRPRSRSALPERRDDCARGGCSPELRPQQGLGAGGLCDAR